MYDSDSIDEKIKSRKLSAPKIWQKVGLDMVDRLKK